MVLKGRISSVLDGGKLVTVAPYGGGVVTIPLAVPFFLYGLLPVNTVVVYVVFEDNTGLILGRLDGFGHIDDNNGDNGSISISSAGDAIIFAETGDTKTISAHTDGDAIVIEENGNSSKVSVYADSEAIVFQSI